jgi:hypothetical protein
MFIKIETYLRTTIIAPSLESTIAIELTIFIIMASLGLVTKYLTAMGKGKDLISSAWGFVQKNSSTVGVNDVGNNLREYSTLGTSTLNI